MAVTITWNDSSDVATTLFLHGTVAAGSNSASQLISVEHDGLNQITGCRFWLDAFSGIYSGATSAANDINEFLVWGDGSATTSFGGFQVNMDAAGSFPVDKWPTATLKFGDDFSGFYTGRGDSSTNGVLLHSNMNSEPPMPANGTIPASCTTWPSFRARISIPSIEDSAGKRQVTQKLRFTYTS